MSQLPKYGGPRTPNVVKVTTTKTTRVAGTNTTKTESKTVIADISTCGGTPTSTRGTPGTPRPGPSSLLRPPTSSGISSLSRSLNVSDRQVACTLDTCPSGYRTPKKSTGQPQVLVQGLPRPSSAQRSILQQSQTERSQSPAQPRELAFQSPKATGLLHPRSAALLQSTAMYSPRPKMVPLHQPKRSGLMRPSPSRFQSPVPARVQMAVQTTSTASVAQRSYAPAKESRSLAVPGAPAKHQKSPHDKSYEKFMAEAKYKIRKPKPVTILKTPLKASERASFSLANKSMQRVGEKVLARAATVSPIQPQFIDTPAGKEQILKQTLLEKRVERDEEGEKIMKNLQIIGTDEVGRPKVIEMNLQQLDPRYPLADGKEVISIASKVSLSESYTTVAREASRAMTKTIPECARIPPEEVAKLVEEENEDVDNTLKMLPPDLALTPGKYEVKKRLQHLQLNSESVALLEQSITRPEPRPDEAQNEPTPEVMAAMMHTVEKGVPPQSTPDQVFNSLFVETSNERYIKLSPVTQGPLQDVVVPTEVPQDVHKEVITDDMEKLTEKLQNIPTAAELPVLDIFDRIMTEDKKSPTKGKNKEMPFPLITDEKSLWVNANLEHLVNVVGATPVEVLEPANMNELEASATLTEHLEAGMEYYIDADPIQYMSRVQLRGTQLPSYFPGYMLALPEFPDVVKLASGPDEVFASAWKSAQPKYFSDDSMQSTIIF